MPLSRIQQLAAIINDSVGKIQAGLDAKKLPSPSFDEDNPQSLPLEVADAQNAAIDAANEIRDLLMEPMSMIHSLGAHNNSLCQEAIAHFDIAAMVPSSGQISFADIATKTGLSEQMVGRLLRHAMTMRIFCEPDPGMVSHTKASKILVDPVIDALKRYPGSQEPNETGFCLANNTTESIYQFLGAHPERASRFGDAMMAYGRKPEHSPAFITDHYDWKALGHASVVHIGGGAGHFAIALAEAHPNLRIIVQDMGFMMGPREAGVPESLKDRVTFKESDQFSPQTVEADVYYFRWSLRNWADKYCQMAFTALIPKLKLGARIIIQDVILPEPGAGPNWKERNARSADLAQIAAFNARDRTIADWKALLQQTDKRFSYVQDIEPKGSALGILEFIWESKA